MLQSLQDYKLITKIHQLDTRYTNETRCTRDEKVQAIYTMSQACPKWHLLHLDCLHWQSTTTALKDQSKYCLPKWDAQYLLYPHHKDKQIIRYSTNKPIAHVNIRKIEHIAAVNKWNNEIFHKCVCLCIHLIPPKHHMWSMQLGVVLV